MRSRISSFVPILLLSAGLLPAPGAHAQEIVLLPESPLPLGPSSTDVVAGDVNGDGHIDFVSSDEFGVGVPRLRIYLGNGDGAFDDAGLGIGGAGANFVSLHDVNDDDVLDVVLGNFPIGQSEPRLSLALGTGGGNFAPLVPLPSGPNPRSVAAADVNGDGHLDLVVYAQGDRLSSIPQSIALLHGSGDGTFAVAQQIALGGFPLVPGVRHMALADFDADGAPDLTVYRHTGVIQIHRGLPNGKFSQTPTTIFDLEVLVSGVEGTAGAFDVADVDGDGHPDIVASYTDTLSRLVTTT